MTCIFPDPLQKSHACLPSLLDMRQNPHVLLTFGKMLNPLRLPHKPHLNLQKWSEHVEFFAFDVEMCFAPRGVHFLDVSTPKSAPTLKCFVHFYLEMCFAPQRRAIFHLASSQMAPHLSLLLFSSLTLHTSAFPSLHIVGSLTSILPSVNSFRFEILKKTYLIGFSFHNRIAKTLSNIIFGDLRFAVVHVLDFKCSKHYESNLGY